MKPFGTATASLCLLALAAGSNVVRAQDYPSGRITAVVALAAGGSMDVLTRLYGQKLSEQFGQPFVVENRGGAAGNLAATAVARAAPDGRTLLVASSGVYSINGTYFKQLSYSPEKDLAPVALYAKIPFILVAGGSSKIHSFNDLVNIAKSSPGALTYGSTGISSAPHMAGELLKASIKVDLLHVPYRGSMNEALTDVMANRVDLIFADPSLAMPLIKDGKLRAFGVSSIVRLPQMPDLPTIKELVDTDFEAVSWHALAVPAGTPAEIQQKLAVAMMKIFADSDLRERVIQMGMIPMEPVLGPQPARDYISGETRKWAALLQQLGLAGSE